MADNSQKTKVTVSLSSQDASLIPMIKVRTGAYTASEVVRDALRHRHSMLTEGSTV